MKKRITTFYSVDKMLETIFPEELKKEIRELSPSNFEEALRTVIRFLASLINRETEDLEVYCNLIRERAEAKEGIIASPYRMKCTDSSCIICQGKYRNHFPYFKNVTVKELPSLMLRIGFDQKEVNEFFELKDTRHTAIAVGNVLTILAKHLGVLETRR